MLVALRKGRVNLVEVEVVKVVVVMVRRRMETKVSGVIALQQRVTWGWAAEQGPRRDHQDIKTGQDKTRR